MKVVSVNRKDDFEVTFDDGTKYSVLEGVVPSWMTYNGEQYTSDILFIMDTTTEDWKLVDWRCGATLTSVVEAVEICKELKERG